MNLVTLKDWSAEEVATVLEVSLAMKADPDRFDGTMKGKNLALLFQKTSTRTRYSSEIGMLQLGGQAVYLDWDVTNFGLADLADEIKVLSLYSDLMLVRLLKHADVLKATAASRVPVMNGCCDRYHPLQGLADIMTIREAVGRLDGIRLTYVGVRNNVCNSLVAAGVKVGMHVTAVTPEVNPAAADEALYEEARRVGLFDEEDDLAAALARSDVVYTDTWIDMEYFTDPDFAVEKERRLALFQPYQLNAETLGSHKVRIMHCLPAHRGYEIDGAILNDPRSIIFDQAENRLHSQKAVILKLAGKLL
ncbi:MAG: ornithine carbamoyltransferase [Deltaproteobacteria bacterium]|nr:ornithine carbamoyltransferase [Deltaproteobacteria bacterium]